MKAKAKPTRLSASHQALIVASAISPEVTRARGYFTAETKAELDALGFARHQQRTPALVVPIHTVHGAVGLHQARPEDPRKNKRGKAIKYETPAGASMLLDVPPSIRDRLGDPTVPLWITEGVRKADSAVSHGLVCIALLGVWNWRGKNGMGGITALADWELIALKGREVFVAFDSDVMTKPEVQQALRRFLKFLESRGAKARAIYLKAGPKGEKVGLDDFFAAGGTVKELEAIAPTASPAASAEESDGATGPYRISDGGLVLVKYVKGVEATVRLTNFMARIVADIVEDDGVETTRHYEIEARTGEATITFRVPAAEFPLLNWVPKHLGPTAILMAGTTVRDHTRVAIQMFSQESGVRTERVYSHTGWRVHNGAHVYLHAGGAIGQDGAVAGIDVRLDSPLDRYLLPPAPAGDQLRRDIAASSRILELGELRITLPVFAAIWRSVLAPTDATIHLFGKSGAFKTELASLAQRHFGRSMSANNLPGSWQSTANALEGLAFLAKDAVFVIDDYLPSAFDAARANRDADRIIRAKGNASGRARMRADTSLRPPKPPRALLLSTGEDVPRGQSLRARMLIVEVPKGAIDSDRLTACQRDAAEGAYDRVLSAYVRWLAKRRPQIMASLAARTTALRDEISQGDIHRRTPAAVADLLIVGSSRVDLQACKLEYSIVSPK